MLKYYDVAVVFAEFPDEITLGVNISQCPGHCGHMEKDENGKDKFVLDCSEPWLLEDVGTELTDEEIDKLIEEHPDITVFGLMGGDNDHKAVVHLANYIHEKYPNIKVGMYSGREFLNIDLLNCLDLYKIGRWIMPDMKHPETWKDHSWGPLVWPVSNQLLFEKVGNCWFNTTYKFRQHPIGDWSKYVIIPEENKEEEEK